MSGNTYQTYEDVENDVNNHIRTLLIDIDQSLRTIWQVAKTECNPEEAMSVLYSWIGEYRELIEMMDEEC